jgi:formylglycine-generating enzyme
MSFSRAVARASVIGRSTRNVVAKRFTSLSVATVVALAAACSGDDTGSDLKCGAGTKEVSGKCVLADSGTGGNAGAASGTGGIAGDAGSTGVGGIATGGSAGSTPDASTGGSAGETPDGSSGGSAGDAPDSSSGGQSGDASTGGSAGTPPDAATGGSAGTVSDASSGGSAGSTPDASTGGAGGTADASTGGAGPDGGVVDSGVPDAGGCPPWFTDAGTSVGAASCTSGAPGAGNNCGYQGLDDCCASVATPCGAFNRSNNALYPASVSSFRLDKYEVTVGRFRKFVEAGGGVWASAPTSGSGAHPNIAATGWDSSWSTSLSAQPADLIAKLKCATKATWTDTSAGNETRPINCVDWYTAFAFCVWDGGRLPTEAEWNYAAAGGSQQYYYAFGQGPGANINANNVTCSAASPLPVGTPQWSFGYWDHWDQSGNVEEWTFDRTGQYSVPCVDCVTLVNGVYPGRAVRGGHYHVCVGAKPETGINTEKRINRLETSRTSELGFRCAREL